MAAALNAVCPLTAAHSLLEQLDAELVKRCTCGRGRRAPVDDHAIARKLVGYRIAHEKTLEELEEHEKTPGAKQLEAARACEFLRGRVDGLNAAIKLLRDHGVEVEEDAPPKRVRMVKLERGVTLRPPPAPHFSPLPSSPAKPSPPTSGADATAPASSQGDRKLVAGERRILDALDRMPDGLTRKQLATLAGMADSGTFAKYLGNLRALEALEDLDDGRIIRGDGGPSRGPRGKPPTTKELEALWSSRLVGKCRAMFHALIKLYPGEVSRDDLRAAVGIADSGTFSKYLGILKANDLAEEMPSKRLRASSSFFLSKGRRK
jgi:hypothetical protein